jgi:hypothetical protein
VGRFAEKYRGVLKGGEVVVGAFCKLNNGECSAIDGFIVYKRVY